MPVTKTARRALRVSTKKRLVNKSLATRLEIALRLAKKQKTKKHVSEATSLADRAAKRNLIHKNKASRIKRSLSKLAGSKPTKKKS